MVTPKIVEVTSFPVTYGHEREAMSYCFVKIVLDDGTTGYGEACDSYGCTYASLVATVIDEVFGPLLLGQDLEAVDPLTERMRMFTRRRIGEQWIAAQARSACENALWDAAGKKTGKSVSRMIGRVRDTIEIYASSVFLEEGDAEWHTRLLSPLLEQGVRRVKVRIGPDWSVDIETLHDVRKLLGNDIEIMVDGSEIFTLPTAVHVGRLLQDLGVTWFEEPLPQRNREGMTRLGTMAPIAIAYGEHLFGVEDAIDALRQGHCDVLQPDASTCGGISTARAMATIAGSFGVRVVPHSCAGPVSLAANLQFAATVPSIRLLEYTFTMAPAWSALSATNRFAPTHIRDGHLAIPDDPGLGCNLDLDAVRSHPYINPGARLAGTVSGLPDRFVGDR
jgi:D-galactarolactone cycloisomerase